MFTLKDGREFLYQWDIDRQVIVSDPSIVEVHFCNRTDECSLVVEVKEENGIRVANVPNILLQSSFDIRVFGYDGKATLHDKIFKVKPRTRPADYVYTETEVLSVQELAYKYVQEAITNNPELLDTVTIDVTGCGETLTKIELTDDILRFVESSRAGKDTLVILRYINTEFIATTHESVSGEQYHIVLRGTPAYISGEESGWDHRACVVQIIDYGDGEIRCSGKCTRISEFATEEYVDNAIANIDLPEGGDVDLSDYYTKDDVDVLIADTTEDLASKEYVTNAINTAFAGIATAEGGSY